MVAKNKTAHTKKTLDVFWFLISIWRREWKLIALGAAAMTLASGLQLAIPVGAKSLMTLSADASPLQIVLDVALVVCCVVGFHMVSLAGHLLAHRVTLDVSFHLSTMGLGVVCSSEWQSLAKRNPVEVLQCVMSAAKVTGDTIATVVTELIASVFAAFGILAAVVYISWELTLFFLTVVALSQGFSYLYSVVFQGPSALVHSRDEARLSALLNNAIQRSATIRIYKCSDWIREVYRHACNQTKESGLQLNFQIHFHAAVSSAISNSMFVSMIGIAAYLQSQGKLSLVDIGIFFFYMKQLLDRILVVVGEVRRMSVLLGKAEDFFDLINDSAPNSTLHDGGCVSVASNAGVVMESVCFSYENNHNMKHDSTSANIIDSDSTSSPLCGSSVTNFSLNVGAGEFVGLVGKSGSGKSTILKILAGLLKAQSGCIKIPLTVAFLEQAPAIFVGTIRDNIGIGRQGTATAQVDISDIRAAAVKAGCDHFISALPCGYDTVIENPDHAQFSGGQLQRLCLARLFLSDAQLVLLDEPTTGLDTEAAAVVLDSAKKLKAEGRTVIFASHDAKALGLADRIITIS